MRKDVVLLILRLTHLNTHQALKRFLFLLKQFEMSLCQLQLRVPAKREPVTKHDFLFSRSLYSITVESDTGIEDNSCYFGLGNIGAVPKISERYEGLLTKIIFIKGRAKKSQADHAWYIPITTRRPVLKK